MKNIAFILVLIFCVLTIKAQETGTFKDERDGNIYNTVKIGTQIWMAENLAYKPTNNKCKAYGNDESNVEKYGYLYDWNIAQKVCPSGWHLPSNPEWEKLEKALENKDVADKLKSTEGWSKAGCTSGNGINSSGFNALPGGHYDEVNGFLYSKGNYAYWWTNTPNENNAYSRYCNTRSSVLLTNWDASRERANSVRCVKD